MTDLGWQFLWIGLGFVGLQLGAVLICLLGLKYLPEDTQEETA